MKVVAISALAVAFCLALPSASMAGRGGSWSTGVGMSNDVGPKSGTSDGTKRGQCVQYSRGIGNPRTADIRRVRMAAFRQCMAR